MDLETAKIAGAIAANIERLTVGLADVDKVISEGWVVVDVRVRNPVTKDERSMVMGELDPTMSALALSTAKTTYETLLADLQAQLAALGA